MGGLVLGIDDAGRGPVIGPMVLAGCLIKEETESEFKSSGIKDSKQLTQKRREFLEMGIKDKAVGFDSVLIFPTEIDDTNAKGIGLNEVEAIACAKIINKLNDGKEKIRVVVDCPSVSISKWREFLRSKIDNMSNIDLICEHKADQNHVSVSAASILAKTERERQMDILKNKYGQEIGSGYGSDIVTQRFLEKYAHKYKDDGIFRKTWSNWVKASNDLWQQRLSVN